MYCFYTSKKKGKAFEITKYVIWRYLTISNSVTLALNKHQRPKSICLRADSPWSED